MACFYLERAPEQQLNDLKLMKLMYLAERESLRRFSASITGDAYYSMPKGPVLSQTYRLMRHEEPQSAWNDFIDWRPFKAGGVSENTVKLRKPLESKQFLSEAELQILAEIWERYKDKNKWSLVDLTHTFPEWDEDAKTYRTSLEIKPETIFVKGFEESPEAAQAKVNDIEYYEALGA